LSLERGRSAHEILGERKAKKMVFTLGVCDLIAQHLEIPSLLAVGRPHAFKEKELGSMKQRLLFMGSW
jgi:hypothetical protein